MYKRWEYTTKLWQMRQRLGRTPSRREVDKTSGPKSTSFNRMFGSFVKACKASGIKPPKRGGPGGTRHGSWRHGRIRNNQGYIRRWLGTRKYVLEHRYILEQHLGRSLKPNEIVHHRNGIKDDNRLENLEIVLRTTHRGEVVCPHCQNSFSIR